MNVTRNYVNLNVNPCKMCMPMGGSLALKGIEGSMTIIHGSQGCSTYIRRHISAHYNEPVDIASSSLTEQGTVYGGRTNLFKGIKNIIELYNPKVVGVLTSCLAETIGEDIARMIKEFKEEGYFKKLDIIPINTPGYAATHYEGYYHSIKEILKYYVAEEANNDSINIIVGSLSPGDIREIKWILEAFGISEYTLLPDISDTLDAPYKRNYTKIPEGGTKIEDIKKMGGAIATIELGNMVPEQYSPGRWLEENFQVPFYSCPIPIGLKNTDRFIKLIATLTGKNIPISLKKARGRMLDAMIDSHKYNKEGKAAVFGNPDILYGITSLCSENGIEPKIIATGAKINDTYKYLIQKIQNDENKENRLIIDNTDFQTIQSLLKDININILIGNSDGKFITEKEGVPLVRIGFPIHDHIGAQRNVSIGYEGSLRLLDQITNILLDQKHNTYRENMYNTYYKKEVDLIVK